MHKLEMALVADLHDLPPQLLLGRPLGEQFFPYIEAECYKTPEQQALLIVFSLEQQMNASFADETVVELAHCITQHQYGERGVVVTGLNRSSEFDLVSAFAARRVIAHREGGEFTAAVIFMIAEATREWKLVGDLEPTLHEALRFVGSRGEVTAAELAEALQLELKAASTRLKRLHERFLLWRQERKMPTGREFVYYFWF